MNFSNDIVVSKKLFEKTKSHHFFIMCLGPPDPLKTGFVRQSSTVICTAKLAQILSIEPRDEFSNLCQFSDIDDPAKGYVAEISQVCSIFCKQDFGNG